MPLVRIDLVEGRPPAQLRALADAVQEALVDTFDTPERDRYQVIHQHREDELIVLDTGLGLERDERDVVVLQITQQGRDDAQKAAVCARLAELLDARGLCRPEDLVVSIVESTKADWSFGHGRMQFMTGEL